MAVCCPWLGYKSKIKNEVTLHKKSLWVPHLKYIIKKHNYISFCLVKKTHTCIHTCVKFEYWTTLSNINNQNCESLGDSKTIHIQGNELQYCSSISLSFI
jgi:hypothetical protein